MHTTAIGRDQIWKCVLRLAPASVGWCASELDVHCSQMLDVSFRARRDAQRQTRRPSGDSAKAFVVSCRHTGRADHTAAYDRTSHEPTKSRPRRADTRVRCSDAEKTGPDFIDVAMSSGHAAIDCASPPGRRRLAPNGCAASVLPP